MISVITAAVLVLSAQDLDQVLNQRPPQEAYVRRVARGSEYAAIGQARRSACNLRVAATEAAFDLKEVKLTGKVWAGEEYRTLTPENQAQVDLRILGLERDAARYEALCGR